MNGATCLQAFACSFFGFVIKIHAHDDKATTGSWSWSSFLYINPEQISWLFFVFYYCELFFFYCWKNQSMILMSWIIEKAEAERYQQESRNRGNKKQKWEKLIRHYSRGYCTFPLELKSPDAMWGSSGSIQDYVRSKQAAFMTLDVKSVQQKCSEACSATNLHRMLALKALELQKHQQTGKLHFSALAACNPRGMSEIEICD